MLGDRLDADRERSGELVHRRLTLGEARHDRAPRRVGESCERTRELVDCHLRNHPIGLSIVRLIMVSQHPDEGGARGKDRRHGVRVAGRRRRGPRRRRGLQARRLELRDRARRGGQQVQARRDDVVRGLAAGSRHLRGLRQGVAVEDRRIRLRRQVQQHAQVRRLLDARGPRVEQLDRVEGRRRRGGHEAEAGAGRRHRTSTAARSSCRR